MYILRYPFDELSRYVKHILLSTIHQLTNYHLTACIYNQLINVNNKK